MTVPELDTGPITASISARVTMPGLNNTASGPASERTVDSIPTVVRPPSSTIATRSPKPSRTCCAVVGESSVKRLALGAAIGTPASRISACAIGLRGHANAHRIQSRGQPIRNMRLFRQHQRQRPGPKFPRQFFGSLRPLAHQAARHFDGTHVNDQRARRRPALRGIDFFDRRGVERVGSQPVDRLGWKCDQFARSDQLPRRERSQPLLRQILFSVARDFAGVLDRPGTRASADPGRHPARDPRRRSKAWCDDPSPSDTAPARSCGSGCRN